MPGCWRDDSVLDATNHCYGLAFVVLAYAKALEAGIEEARDYLEETWQLMERHFWSEADGLYRDEISADWSAVSPYRGQNANMHSCEAMLAAFEATRRARISRPRRAAGAPRHHRPRRQGRRAGLGALRSRLERRLGVQPGRPKHLFRPWGYQPGHQTEWAKLLLILERHRPARLAAADRAPSVRHCHAAGLGRRARRHLLRLRPGPAICDGDKYFWVQAESFAAAALLAARTGEERYWDWYDRIWAYSWQHMVDHRYGAWFRILDQRNEKYSDEKSPAGKTDYHTMGACYEVLNVVAR